MEKVENISSAPLQFHDNVTVLPSRATVTRLIVGVSIGAVLQQLKTSITFGTMK